MNFIKRVVDEWDPIDLLSHSPNDEYHSEIEEIQKLLSKTDDLDELAEGVFKIFVKSFGEEVFNKRKAECEKIAQNLISHKY